MWPFCTDGWFWDRQQRSWHWPTRSPQSLTGHQRMNQWILWQILMWSNLISMKDDPKSASYTSRTIYAGKVFGCQIEMSHIYPCFLLTPNIPKPTVIPFLDHPPCLSHLLGLLEVVGASSYVFSKWLITLIINPLRDNYGIHNTYITHAYKCRASKIIWQRHPHQLGPHSNG